MKDNNMKGGMSIHKICEDHLIKTKNKENLKFNDL